MSGAAEDERAELAPLHRATAELAIERDVLKRRVAFRVKDAMGRRQGLAARRKKKRKATTRPGSGRWRALQRLSVGPLCTDLRDIGGLLRPLRASGGDTPGDDRGTLRR